ncbi:CpsD/CapB family tyrosine-protein kinase [Clostridium sp. PL3]|uniref:non-specific protein-tyrosine kinase n=1 Tax=Clostridium thailandense TaxID=2794346 RepID=A0A949WTI6_9CLOT|nr:CpsD/CapB family tyrosine-protein kinase [Clostridium thailandense]MBV7271522.1 CpsD/CapB family tyrosine-protein kinase [Clostridium thailandense]
MKKDKSNIMERYRRLRNIIEGYGNKVKCISITSNSDIEGKTIIAKNVAMILAENSKKTLFIDCSLTENLNISNHRIKAINGLIGMLEVANSLSIDDMHLKNYIKDTQHVYLSMLTLGTNDLNRYSSLFKTEHLKTVMEYLKKGFDYIIVNTPSFENLSYTQIITAATDGCLFVLKEGVNEINKGSVIKDNIATIRCKILGCILDKEKKSVISLDDKINSLLDVKYRNIENRGPVNDKSSASA